MNSSPRVILTIAGFDPSSGAGVTADLKTIAAHGGYGVGCITALTIQNTRGVFGLEPVPAQTISKTLTRLQEDFELSGIRIGMLGTEEAASAIADFLEGVGEKPVVLDPVLRSSSGAELLDAGGVAVLKKRLLQRATVVTPNLSELAELTGVESSGEQQAEHAAQVLLRMGARAVVVTGGHGDDNTDLLVRPGYPSERFTGLRINTTATHGTGCAFATALACNLASGMAIGESVAGAKDFVRQAIKEAFPLGKGAGPMHHLYRLDRR